MTQWLKVTLHEDSRVRVINTDTIRFFGPSLKEEGRVVIWFRRGEYEEWKVFIVDETLEEILAQMERQQ